MQDEAVTNILEQYHNHIVGNDGPYMDEDRVVEAIKDLIQSEVRQALDELLDSLPPKGMYPERLADELVGKHTAYAIAGGWDAAMEVVRQRIAELTKETKQ